MKSPTRATQSLCIHAARIRFGDILGSLGIPEQAVEGADRQNDDLIAIGMSEP
jgi:hypothetical protein